MLPQFNEPQIKRRKPITKRPYKKARDKPQKVKEKSKLYKHIIGRYEKCFSTT